MGAALLKQGQTKTEEELIAMIKEVDLNNNGTIEFDEFLAMMAPTIKQKEDIKKLDCCLSCSWNCLKCFTPN